MSHLRHQLREYRIHIRLHNEVVVEWFGLIFPVLLLPTILLQIILCLLRHHIGRQVTLMIAL